ncbi:hypothetical protein SAMN05446037_1006134 [Anaerovirgula multivorans]|uniref:Uncharacterized protein n=1 Tax=Anaerovirgula multivorans TaxID=312168 RepID=A0A239CV11_9FIRM|nr:hypothetical protein [Anaerovirgula multivorans]SNS23183.1 hypothetical protein SAMN05446037_1006134 [Anaerovirgula multivorans]
MKLYLNNGAVVHTTLPELDTLAVTDYILDILRFYRDKLTKIEWLGSDAE